MDHSGRTQFFLLFYIVAGFYIAGLDGLKDVRLEGPGYVRRGDTVTLSCKYDMERDTLYAVKWFKWDGREFREFYRYVPKEAPPTQVFQLPGINVDMILSNDHDVTLHSVPLEISGKFRCLVSAESTFQTFVDIKELNVVAVGYGSPILSANQDTFHGGETVKANCSIGQTTPPVNITWYLADQEVRPGIDGNIKTSTTPDANDTTVATTLSMITFKLPENFSPKELKCTGRLHNVYQESSIFNIRRTPVSSRGYMSSPDTLLRSNSTNQGFAQDFHRTGGILLVVAQLLLYLRKTVETSL